MNERSGPRSLIPALTRSPASAASPVQTCFTSMAVTNQTTKCEKHFWLRARAFYEADIYSCASWTRCYVILHIKSVPYAASLAVSLSKGSSLPPGIRRSHFLTCQRVIVAVCLVSCRDSSGLGLSDTSRLTLWLTGVVKTAGVTSNTWQHISKCDYANLV